MKVETKATVQNHAKWIAEKVAEAREIGIRDGTDGLKVAHVIALLFKQCDEKDKRIAELENQKAIAYKEVESQVRKTGELQAQVLELRKREFVLEKHLVEATDECPKCYAGIIISNGYLVCPECDWTEQEKQ